MIVNSCVLPGSVHYVVVTTSSTVRDLFSVQCCVLEKKNNYSVFDRTSNSYDIMYVSRLDLPLVHPFVEIIIIGRLQSRVLFYNKIHIVYLCLLHTRSLRAVRYRGAILKAILNAGDTDRTSYLRHDVAIAYEMARAMTKSSPRGHCRWAPYAGFTCTHAFYAVKINYRCLKCIVGQFSPLSSAPVL